MGCISCAHQGASGSLAVSSCPEDTGADEVVGHAALTGGAAAAAAGGKKAGQSDGAAAAAPHASPPSSACAKPVAAPRSGCVPVRSGGWRSQLLLPPGPDCTVDAAGAAAEDAAPASRGSACSLRCSGGGTVAEDFGDAAAEAVAAATPPSCSIRCRNAAAAAADLGPAGSISRLLCAKVQYAPWRQPAGPCEDTQQID